MGHHLKTVLENRELTLQDFKAAALPFRKRGIVKHSNGKDIDPDVDYRKFRRQRHMIPEYVKSYFRLHKAREL